MSFDADNLGPAVDIDSIDIATLDKGDTLEALEEALKPEDDPKVDEMAEELTGAKDEDDGEGEESPEEKVEEEQPRNEKGQFEKKEARIPKSRFDEQVGKERAAREAAENRAAALEKQLAERQAQEKQGADVQAMEDRVSAMEKEYNNLLLDGEADKASELMSQIRKIERQIVRAETEQASVQRTSQVLEAERVELAIAQLEAAHPTLNPDSELFDESLVNFVLSEQRRLIQIEGLSPSRAITKAATTIVERYAPKAAEQHEAPKGLSKAAEDRKAEAVKRNIQTARQQPASMKDTGLDSDKFGQSKELPDVTKMTQDEFNALPESTKAKLRGDFL